MTVPFCNLIDEVNTLAINAEKVGIKPAFLLVHHFTFDKLIQAFLSDRRYKDTNTLSREDWKKFVIMTAVGTLRIKVDENIPVNELIVTDQESYREYLDRMVENTLLGITNE